MSRLVALFILALGALPGTVSAASYDYWITGNPADARPATTRAGLVLAGGGSKVVAAWKWFVACAGGGDIVVLRAGKPIGVTSISPVSTFNLTDLCVGRPVSTRTVSIADGTLLDDPATK